MKPTKIIGAVVGSLAVYFIGALLISYALIHPKRRKSSKTPSDFGLKYKTVKFKSVDGINLAGWLIKAEKPKGTIIISHGYGYSKADVLKAAEILKRNNYSIFLFDYRAHGESQGKISGLGVLEVNDLLGAIEYLKKTREKNIGLFGFSMGASTSIVAASKTKIACVIADSGYSELSKVIISKLSVFGPMVIKLLKVQGVDVENNMPISSVDKINCPLLIIHSKKDGLVHVRHAKELYSKAKKPKNLWLIDSSDHARGYQNDPKLYERKVLDFLGRCFKI